MIFPSEYVSLDDGRRIEVRAPLEIEWRHAQKLDLVNGLGGLMARCAGLEYADVFSISDSDRRAICGAIDRTRAEWRAVPRAERRRAEAAIIAAARQGKPSLAVRTIVAATHGIDRLANRISGNG